MSAQVDVCLPTNLQRLRHADAAGLEDALQHAQHPRHDGVRALLLKLHRGVAGNQCRQQRPAWASQTESASLGMPKEVQHQNVFAACMTRHIIIAAAAVSPAAAR